MTSGAALSAAPPSWSPCQSHQNPPACCRLPALLSTVISATPLMCPGPWHVVPHQTHFYLQIPNKRCSASFLHPAHNSLHPNLSTPGRSESSVTRVPIIHLPCNTFSWRVHTFSSRVADILQLVSGLRCLKPERKMLCWRQGMEPP